ncbi:hypothetical protein CACET_c10470 [Clostridium aceticum]|uniref:Uncharacterized protein n=1 Tax=Clostridium aceticum TaxID=84022 RepID=A0A0G3W9M6_9CLOT|nr:hypothetical protein [Clostridium aceticum]AKL94550.1 hypothetical protein CACET_c10470 [Clostridium aceticum]
MKKFPEENCFFLEKLLRYYLKNGRQCSDEMTLKELLDSYGKSMKTSKSKSRNAQ